MPNHKRDAQRLLAMVEKYPDSSDSDAIATAAVGHALLAVIDALAGLGEIQAGGQPPASSYRNGGVR